MFGAFYSTSLTHIRIYLHYIRQRCFWSEQNKTFMPTWRWELPQGCCYMVLWKLSVNYVGRPLTNLYHLAEYLITLPNPELHWCHLFDSCLTHSSIYQRSLSTPPWFSYHFPRSAAFTLEEVEVKVVVLGLMQKRKCKHAATKTPTTLHSQCKHKPTTGQTKKPQTNKQTKRKQRERKTLMIYISHMLLKANCFDYTLNHTTVFPARSAPKIPQECVFEFQSATSLEMTTFQSVYLVSTSKCYAEVHPCQKKKKKTNQLGKINSNVTTLQALLLLVSDTL